ncbi:Oligosaccharyltransferase subunit Ribophorin II-domain-containing protein [Hyaloraphidium curvatum]|nr:Oligosaccharyltransferase subunit Ribophorin II-domain-containing protein [Hyaloraphidium curvatum]
MARPRARPTRRIAALIVLVAVFFALAVFSAAARAAEDASDEAGGVVEQVVEEVAIADIVPDELLVGLAEGQEDKTTEAVPDPPAAEEPAADAAESKSAAAEPPAEEPVQEEPMLKVLPHYAEIAIKEIRARVAGADGSMGEVQKLTYPNKFPQPLEVSYPGALKLAFKVYDGKLEDKPPLAVNQAVLVLTNRETKEDSSFIAEASKVGTYGLDVDLNSAAVLESLRYRPGTYEMSLVLGSFSTTHALKYDVGALKIILPLPNEPGYVAPAKEGPAGAGAQDPVNYAVKPEITHVFRPGPKQAPVVVSGFFTLLVLSPWLLLLAGWQQLGFSPLSGSSASTSQGPFVIAIAALPVLMYLYWTRLNLFQLLGYMAGWGCFTFITGRRALREHAAQRIRTEGGKAKKTE